MRASMQREFFVGLVLAGFLALAPAAHGKVTSSATTAPTCLTLTGTASNCVDTAFLTTTTVGANSDFFGVSATFTTAFNAWDAGNGDAWTLVNGGTVDVSISPHITLSASPETAGLGEVLFTLNGSQQTLSNLVWTQALIITYSPLTGPLSHPEATLDTFSLSQNAAGSNPNFPKTCVAPSSGASPANGAFCGPIYPFQYGSTLATETVNSVTLGVDPFYDAPQGDWPNATFDAITLLSTVSAATDTLTVYQGVNYGFTLTAESSASAAALSGAGAILNVPEPSTWAMLGLGFAGLALARYRRTSFAR